jgi:uncharacterized glyoxalase superfamily protein PhnB
MLSYEDPATAIPWLERAFGFIEEADQRRTESNGRITHAQLAAGAGLVMLANPTLDYRNPRNHRESCADADLWLSVPWVVDGVLVYVDDVDAHLERARDVGAVLLSGVEETPAGRLYRVEDVEGHRWMFMERPQSDS